MVKVRFRCCSGDGGKGGVRKIGRGLDARNVMGGKGWGSGL